MTGCRAVQAGLPCSPAHHVFVNGGSFREWWEPYPLSARHVALPRDASLDGSAVGESFLQQSRKGDALRG